MELALFILIIVHGTIHFLGFIKAFNIAHIGQTEQNMTRLQGGFWLLSGCMFIFAAILLAAQCDLWWVFSLLAIIISQYLIINDWHDARFGTIPNAIILVITIVGFLAWSIMRD